MFLDKPKDNPSLTVYGDHLISEGSPWKSSTEMNKLLLHILQHFPKHELRGFR